MDIDRRTSIAAGLTALAFLVLPAAPALADDPGVRGAESPQTNDTRWIAWAGCWEASEDGTDAASRLLVCFEPMADRDGVEIRTILGGDVVAFEEVVTDGRMTPIEESGCTGTRSAAWSEDGARVFLESTLRCAEGITRSTRGVMALTGNGDRFLEIHAARSGEEPPVVGVQRYVPAREETLEAQGVEAPRRERDLAVRTTRAALAAPLEPSGVVELVDRAGPEVARALIAEAGDPFALSADLLRDLAEQGVPGDVIDVMVAVTFPERFEIADASWEASRAPRVGDRGSRYADGYGGTGRHVYLGIDPFFHYDPYFYGSGFYTPYGPRWGYRSPFHGGTVIIVRPQVRDRQARVSPNSGYVPGASGSTDRSAVRRGSPSPGAMPRIDASTRPTIPRAAPSPTRRVTPSGASSSSGDDRRRARPKPRGNGNGSGT